MMKKLTYALIVMFAFTTTTSFSSIQTYRAHGVVKSIDLQTNSITLSQDCITALGWPVRDMMYTANGSSILNNIAVGQTVDATITADSPYHASIHFITPTSH